ncbi:hypothetical protein ABZZ20_21095 [Streptomyces sp. NPDC006430]|uniref:hypothetical protein n=1 Tax=Streptomyces sp. NPDC006430 TaxID=3154299 RepID=UPI0033A5EC3E
MSRPPRLAVYGAVVCALATAAAVMSFVRGEWAGIVWLLLAGLASNIAWYYARRAGARTGSGSRKVVAGQGSGPSPTGCASSGACGGCEQKTC